MARRAENYLEFIKEQHGYYSNYPVFAPISDTGVGGGAHYNVKAYGAKGNGVTNDAPALQALFNTVSALPYGASVFFPAGCYVVDSPLLITGQNINIYGIGWAMTQPTNTNPVSLATPSSTLQPSVRFPNNKYVLTFSNVNTMSLGCSMRGMNVDGTIVQANGASSQNNVGGLNLNNAAFFILDSTTWISLTGSCVYIDMAGNLYSTPSVSQMWINNIVIVGNNHSKHGIEFGANLFASDFYISNFWIENLGNGYGIYTGAAQTSLKEISVHSGFIQNSTGGIFSTASLSDYHDIFMGGMHKHGIYVKNTNASAGGQTLIHHNRIFGVDQNADGSAGIYIDTGSHSCYVSHNVLEKGASGEFGIIVKDGFGVNGNIVDDSNYATGFTTANFVNGSTNITATRPTLSLPAAVAGAAPLNLATSAGTAPSAPNDGDIWYDGTNVKVRVGGTTKTFTIT